VIFEIVKSSGIAHKSYLIGSGGSAAVIDPRRDCEIYIDIAEKNNLKIYHIFETHRNEDYVTGSLELTELVGAEIYHGGGLEFAYGNVVDEGDKFYLGSLKLEILKTPGHTDESISITLKDNDISDHVYMVFSGDTLFAGEVGRADLYGESETVRWQKISITVFSIKYYHWEMGSSYARLMELVLFAEQTFENRSSPQ